MGDDINLLDLPDLVLYHVCTFITNPFDLVCFGNTCSRLRSISSVSSLWWPITFQWCDGLWIYMTANNEYEHPRDWLMELFKKVIIRTYNTELKCVFSNGEVWERVDSSNFRCILGWLRLAHPRRETDHPAVLFEQWLYDVGLYRRVNVQTDFTAENFEFSENQINVLSKLGQAADRDLRRRKQPNKDPKYYVKHVATAEANWVSELFPSGSYSTTTCPFLMCPFQNALTPERTGLQGLSVSLSIVLAKFLKRGSRFSHLVLMKDIFSFIKTFCTLFQQEVMNNMTQPRYPLKSHVLSIINEKSFNTDLLEAVLSVYKVNFSCRDIITEFSKFICQYEGIDYMVDKVRSRLRESMLSEINRVLFQNLNNCTLTRINLTDSDLICGDNSKQEMACAAFISQQGVLVSWHLTGRMRF